MKTQNILPCGTLIDSTRKACQNFTRVKKSYESPKCVLAARADGRVVRDDVLGALQVQSFRCSESRVEGFAAQSSRLRIEEEEEAFLYISVSSF